MLAPVQDYGRIQRWPWSRTRPLWSLELLELIEASSWTTSSGFGLKPAIFVTFVARAANRHLVTDSTNAQCAQSLEWEVSLGGDVVPPVKAAM